jgi:hypothetical protein
MSDLLQLATALRSNTDAALLATLRRRVGFGSPKDFFDLAQNLLAAKSVQPALNKLSGSEARALKCLVDGRIGDANPQAVESLTELALVYVDAAGRPQAFETVAAMSAPMLPRLAPEPGLETAPIKIGMEPNRAELGLAAIAAFETQQAVYELLLDAEQNPIKLTGKTGFGVSDVKRLATHLRRTPASVRAYYQLSEQLQLLQLIGERWWLTSAASEYLNGTILDRWLTLAEQWVTSLGPVGAKELGSVLHFYPELDLVAALKTVFPLADSQLGEVLDQLAEQAQGIGFSVAGRPSVLLEYCLSRRTELAADLLQQHLPQLQHSLIVQADLSLIAPGPLDSATESVLRQFAEIEQVSVASTYRMSPLSVSHGLECGLTIEGIRTMLLDLNAKPLPQPVEYLLREAESRFGRLTISPGPGGPEKAIIKSTDAILLTQVLNDSRLRAFAFQATTAASISTRFDPEVVYFGLRDHGYLAVRLTSTGEVLSPRAALSYGTGLTSAGSHPMDNLINGLRAADDRVGKRPDDQDITRQIQLAIKNKAILMVVAEDRTGSEVEFRILPTALANGRLRGMDKRSDVERTIPLERVKRVQLG